MLNLPITTEFNRRIPKVKFYDKMGMNTNLKNIFVSDIAEITWTNKISSETVNIKKGKEVLEIEVISIRLKSESISDTALKEINKAIPYNIIFVVDNGVDYRIVVFYDTHKIEKIVDDKFSLSLSALNLDLLWNSIVQQIGEVTIEKEHSLSEQLVVNEEKEKLKKQIETLDKKARKEKQPHKRLELVTELDKLKKKLASM